MIFVNLTPHDVRLNDGRIFIKSGDIARVSTDLKKVKDILYLQTYGDIEGLPEPKKDTFFIVSAIVFAATDRKDVVAPATSHKDVVRDEKGQIVSVPGFIIKG